MRAAGAEVETVNRIAEIYRPATDTMVIFKDQLSATLEATAEAGKELVASRKVSPDTMTRVTKPLEAKQKNELTTD